MSTKQAYAVEGQPRILQVERVDGYVLEVLYEGKILDGRHRAIACYDHFLMSKAIWDGCDGGFFHVWLVEDGEWVRTVSQFDVYQAIAFLLHEGAERIELTGKIQI